MRVGILAAGFILRAGCSNKTPHDISHASQPEAFATSKPAQVYAACVSDAWRGKLTQLKHPLGEGYRVSIGLFNEPFGQVGVRPLNGETAICYYETLFLLSFEASEKQRSITYCID